MSKKLNIKIRFENSDKTYKCSLENNNIDLLEQIYIFFKQNNDFKTLDNIKYYSLFDNNSKNYIKNLNELKKYNKKTIFLLKNVSTHVNEILNMLTKLINDDNIFEDETNNQKNKYENIINNLELLPTNYLLINSFMDEFVSNDGINLLFKLISKNNNILREIALKSLYELLSYEENFKYFNEDDNILKEIYIILISTQESFEKNKKNIFNNINSLNISIIKYILKIILKFFLNFNIENKYSFLLIEIIENNSKLTKKEKYANLIKLLNINDITIKESVLTLLFFILSGMDDYKSKQAEIFCQFQKLGLINILKKNKNLKSDIFKNYLNMFSTMINSIINNYYYTIERYKIEIKKFQNYKENLSIK